MGLKWSNLKSASNLGLSRAATGRGWRSRRGVCGGWRSGRIRCWNEMAQYVSLPERG